MAMTNLRGLIACLLLLLVVACSQVAAVEKTVCDDMAKLPASVTTTLDAANPHSALGVLWADAKSGCANGAPTVGVSKTWTAVVWGMLKAVAPTVVPWLIGLI